MKNRDFKVKLIRATPRDAIDCYCLRIRKTKNERHADAKLREKGILPNETDRIAGEIYAPPIRFKRGQSFGAEPRLRAPKPVLEEAGWPDVVAYRIPTVLVRGAGPEGLVDLRKVISPRARRKRKRERE